MNKGAFGKSKGRPPIYKQFGYSCMAEYDWEKYGEFNKYFAQKGHPKEARALAAIQWGIINGKIKYD